MALVYKLHRGMDLVLVTLYSPEWCLAHNKRSINMYWIYDLESPKRPCEAGFFFFKSPFYKWIKSSRRRENPRSSRIEFRIQDFLTSHYIMFPSFKHNGFLLLNYIGQITASVNTWLSLVEIPFSLCESPLFCSVQSALILAALCYWATQIKVYL